MPLSNLLEITQQAANELGLLSPASVVSSTRPQDKQMLALLNAGGRALLRDHEWRDLVGVTTITTVVDTSDYDLPADFDRIVDETIWDRSNHHRVIGPANAQGDRARRESTLGVGGLTLYYRLVGSGIIQLYPTPISVETLAYEYVSKNWVLGDGDEPKALFTADADTPVFDPDLLVRYVKWRFLKAKGIDSTVEFAEFGDLKDKLVAADIGGGTLNMGSPLDDGRGEVFAGTEPDVIVVEGGDALGWE